MKTVHHAEVVLGSGNSIYSASALPRAITGERQTNFKIREAVETDVPAILACLAEAFEPYRQATLRKRFWIQCLPRKPSSIA